MRNRSSFILVGATLAIVAFITTGCPVGIGYPLGTPGKEKINKDLIGNWAAVVDSADMLAVAVTQADEYSYQIEVTETGENFMAESTSFKAWITTVDGQSFLYAKASDVEEENYFTYHYYFKDKKTLVIEDVGLLVGGTDAVASTLSYRKEVSDSMKQPGCFSAAFEYKKQ
ncbi:MAG: hypothetical protein HUU34_20165 [Saprospiraceae bacterium]|jgi:hypothetical protein|nr:hypothetical protein [Saprospiraceae bacterium]